MANTSTGRDLQLLQEWNNDIFTTSIVGFSTVLFMLYYCVFYSLSLSKKMRVYVLAASKIHKTSTLHRTKYHRLVSSNLKNTLKTNLSIPRCNNKSAKIRLVATSHLQYEILRAKSMCRYLFHVGR